VNRSDGVAGAVYIEGTRVSQDVVIAEIHGRGQCADHMKQMIDHKQVTAIVMAGLLCVAVNGHGQEIYRSVGEDGIVSFSDVRTAEAEVIELPASPVSASAVERQQSMIEQQLSVAKALEDSRLAREEAKTKRIAALAAVQPQTVYYQAPEPRYVVGGYRRSWSGYQRKSGYWKPGYGRPGAGKPGYGRPGHGNPGHPGYGPGKPSHPINPGRPRGSTTRIPMHSF